MTISRRSQLPMVMARTRLRLLTLALAAAGCSGEPAGTCDVGALCGSSTRTDVAVGDLQSSLQNASAGDCLVLQAGVHAGDITIPAGVTVVSSTATIEGTSATGAAVTFGAGAGASLSCVSIRGPGGGIGAVGATDISIDKVDIWNTSRAGIYLESSTAQLSNVRVVGARGGGVVFECPVATGGCRDMRGRSAMTDVDVLDADIVGIYVRGQSLVIERGTVDGTRYTGQAGTGIGVVFFEGAAVEMRSTEVCRSGAGSNASGVGVLTDGATTRVVLDGTGINDNFGRGAWAQRMRGQISEDQGVDDPALVLQGGAEFRGNKISAVESALEPPR